MPFAVFPDPQITPVTVAPGITAFTPFSQLTGESVPVGPYVKMMFIRVAMFGSAGAPTLFIRAGTGDNVKINSLTAAVFRGPDPADYVGDVQLFPEAHNVYQIRMGFIEDTTEQWQLGITNNDSSAAQEFTWVVAESEAETAQPWIVASPDAIHLQALVGDSFKQSVQVSNKGTGTLNVTSAGALPVGFTVSPALPLAVQPSQTESLTITFEAPHTPPPPDGKITATATLTASPPDTTASKATGHNQQVSLVAMTQRLEVVLLLDDSGSMAWDARGDSVPAGSVGSRWSELSSATSQFLDLLAHFGKDRGRFGIARFPAGDPTNTATFDIVPMKDIPDVPGMAAAQAAVAAVSPDGGTPMGDGLDRVLAPATTYFSTDAVSVKANRRWLILMSDGAHNAGTHQPLEFISPPVGTAPAGTSLAEKHISLFAVGYGIEGFTDVDHVLMKQLCTGSSDGGQQRFVDEEGSTATSLAAALRDAIKSGLTPTASPRDPDGLLLAGFGEVRHEVQLTQFDRRAALVLNWNNAEPGRLRLELLTPRQERITPENAGQGEFAGVVFRGDSRSQIYMIEPEFLNGAVRDNHDNESTGARHGTWTFLITSPIDSPGGGLGLPGTDFLAERYVYDVLVDSSLQMTLEMDRGTYFAGDPITVSARLTAAGKPVTGASLSLSATVPTLSIANWLSALSIPAEAMSQALDELDNLDSTPLLIKKRAAKLAGFDFDNTRHQVTLQMTDPDGSGVYRATLTDTSTPERYTFYVTATGTADGFDFRREAKQETFVLVQPDPEHSQIEVHQLEPGVAQVTVFPRDRFGNVLMVDPGTVGGFDLTAPGTDLGKMVSRLDGTYTVPVRFDPVVNPAIGFLYDGKEVISPKTALSLGELHYPDRVMAFVPGAVNLTNAQKDPEAALGTVIGKEPDRFVALGAGGHLVVGFEQQVVLGGTDADVTVFVRPDEDQRAYRVEAFSQEHQDWVSLGESYGATKSFQLRTAQLDSTLALRVTDLSGRTRDTELNPLTTPGVSVLGVGVMHTRSGLPEDSEQLPDWLSQAWRGVG